MGKSVITLLHKWLEMTLGNFAGWTDGEREQLLKCLGKKQIGKLSSAVNSRQNFMMRALILLMLAAVVQKSLCDLRDMEKIVIGVFGTPSPDGRSTTVADYLTKAPALKERSQVGSASDHVCVLPPYPDHGTYTATVGLKPGDAVSHTALTYSCERGYRLTGEASPICYLGTWLVTMPTCEKSEEDNVNVPSCGLIMSSSAQFRIETRITSGGTDSKYLEFPWLVALFAPRRKYPQCTLTDSNCWFFRCGGSFISPKVVLSSGNCVHDYKQDKLKVRAGDWNLDTFEEQHPYQERFVNKIIIHPQYYHSAHRGELLMYDAALLVMEAPYTLADNIAFICLPPPNLNVAPTDCKVAGWGVQTFMATGYQSLLKVLALKYMDHDQCERTLRQNWQSSLVLHDSFTCAGGLVNQGACQGDGGSPLMCIADDHYYIRGLASWSVGCGKANIPNVYTDVVKVRSWIDQEMRTNGFTTDTYTHVAYRK